MQEPKLEEILKLYTKEELWASGQRKDRIIEELSMKLDVLKEQLKHSVTLPYLQEIETYEDNENTTHTGTYYCVYYKQKDSNKFYRVVYDNKEKAEQKIAEMRGE